MDYHLSCQTIYHSDKNDKSHCFIALGGKVCGKYNESLIENDYIHVGK